MSGWPSLDRADDERLARSLAAGDPGALIQVMDRYAARLYDYCHALLRDQEAAAGALHDALIIACAEVTELHEPARFRGWLYALGRAECMRRLRDPARPAERHEAPEVEDGFLGEGELARRLEARRLVHGALAGLRGRERETLDLMLRHDLDTAEVAGVLGLDPGEAAALAAEARARLDDALAAAFVARTGRGQCAELAALTAGDGAPLGAADVQRIVRHIQGCLTCHTRRERVAAERLLQVLPVAMMPTDLRGRILTTATDPALAADFAAIAGRAGPVDASGWPAAGGAAPSPDETGEARRAPRGLWPALAAAAAVILIVTGAFFLMPGSSGGSAGAQGDPGAATSAAPENSEPETSGKPSETPTPTPTTTTGTPTPTPTRTTPTPTPSRTPTRHAPSHPATTVPTRTRPGTLSVGGCTITNSGGCAITVQAVGGPVTWSVTGTSPNLTASGGGTLAAGASTTVTASLSGACSAGSGTVGFSPSRVATVTITCSAGTGG